MADAAVAENAGGGGGFEAGAVLGTLPEGVRASFADVKDVGGFVKTATSVIADLHGKAANSSKPFIEQLPEDIRTDKAFVDIKDVAGLAKGYVNAQKLIGVPKDKLLRLPDDPKDEKAWGEIHARLGRPEKPDGYKIDPPQGQQWSDGDKKFHAAILPALHKAGLNQQGVETLMGAWNGFAKSVIAESNATRDAELGRVESALKSELGDAFNKYSEDGELALEHFKTQLKLGDALANEIKSMPVGMRPGLFKLMAHLGSQLREDGVVKGGAGAAGGALTPAEAKQQINALESDAAFVKAFRDKNDPRHADVVAQRAKLFDQAYPGSG